MMRKAGTRYGSLRRIYQLLPAICLTLMSQQAAAAPTHSVATGMPRTVVAFGDSLMAGYQLRPGEGFAPQLEAALKARGRAVTVVPAGVSGDTTAQGKASETISRGSVSGIASAQIRELLEAAAADGVIPWEAVDNVAPLVAHVTPQKAWQYAEDAPDEIREQLEQLIPAKRRTIKVDEAPV